MVKYAYLFGCNKTEGNASLRNLLGGKGANLAEMASIGIPVPPGFTISTEVCDIYNSSNKNYSDEVISQVEMALVAVEEAINAKFGDEQNPLAVSVRSGARVSMPGMMDTILNIGLNDTTVLGLAKQTGDERFAYQSYLGLIKMYGDVALGIDRSILDEIVNRKKKDRGVTLDTELTVEDLKEIVAGLKAKIKEVTSKEFPQDPKQQLWQAISAVFESWNTPRAVDYRNINKLPHDWGTAVNVQAMVFGNMGNDSGTGVAFSRNPATGEKGLFGEFLINAQGEDIVAGIRTPRDIAELAQELPKCYQEFYDYSQKLETHFKDMQDIEFTIQKNKLWILQTRTGKRTAQAEIRIAVDMTREGLIERAQALQRIEPAQIEQVLHTTIDPNADKEFIAKGLAASPGTASGKILFHSKEAVELAKENGDSILVRDETSADDVSGIHAARGILTTRGGVTSHAAVVARGMGKCAIVGCKDIVINWEKEEFTADNRTFAKGDTITLDGSTGEVFVGEVPTISPQVSDELKELIIWEDSTKSLGVLANADSAADAKLARSFGAEGVGLCRTEHMFFETSRIDHFRRAILAESKEEKEAALTDLLPLQKSDFTGILREMEGLPVIIRLLDPPLHEFLPPHYDTKELRSLAKRLSMPFERLEEKVLQLREFNPMLGHRGCRLGITSPELYEMQVRAIMEAAYELITQKIDARPSIMLPLISDVEELKLLKDLVLNTCEQVRKEQQADGAMPPLGVMIELPRAALIAAELAKLVDFFSFGTNDLTQTTFGISRDDGRSFVPFYLEKGIFKCDPFASLDQTGVGELIKLAFERGRSVNPKLKVGICGEHGGDPESIKFLHQLGLDTVSCSPYRVPVARLAASHAALETQV
ncbi:pyruvate, phosphate dikinase [Chloroflexota bacterium]